jgi:hypothetical protein
MIWVALPIILFIVAKDITLGEFIKGIEGNMGLIILAVIIIEIIRYIFFPEEEDRNENESNRNILR